MMRGPLRSLIACLLVGGVFVVGCGGGTEAGEGQSLIEGGTASSSSGGGSNHDSGAGYEYDSGGYTYDSGGGNEVDSGTVAETGTTTGSCGVCTTDTECQSGCPAVQGGGTNCCDVGSGVCYATTQLTCPSPSADAGAE
jgi:hypothetical protein